MKRIISAFLYSNIFISFGGAAAYLYGSYSLKFEWNIQDWLMAIMAFASTYFAYGLTRKKAVFGHFVEDLPQRIAWWLGKKHFFYVSMLMALFVLLSGSFFIEFDTFLAFSLLGLISVLYSITIPGTVLKLRKIRFMKTIFIAFIWACLAALLPLIENSLLDFMPDFWIHKASTLFVQQFLFILAITLPFDIRDMQIDKQQNTQTIPLLIGAKNTLYLATVILAVANVVFQLSIALTLMSIILIVISYQKTNDWFYLGLIDALLILQTLLIWIG